MPGSEQPLKILIADDSDTDRMILQSIVRKAGHLPVAASNGLEAVEVFKEQNPDLVLMDALMPELDGFGAARLIKELAGEAFVPIIFLTSLTDTESLVKCLDAGGDDFLSKPYNHIILQAKIKSFNRMREMHATMIQQRDQIAVHHNHMLQEQRVAKEVFDNIAHSGCLDASNVRSFLSPLAVFNGDVLVAAMHPSGSMLVLLGDFTGHGLPAAIGAMPLASIFYGMARKGFSMTDILHEINLKLTQILPSGVFCCATMVEVNFHKQRIKLWNGGLPFGYMYRASNGSFEVMESRHLPLGILADKDFRDDCIYLDMAEGDRFYLWSDGIHEARDCHEEMFGEERLQQIFRDNRQPGQLFDEIIASVQAFVGVHEKGDDLSLVEVAMLDTATIQRDEDGWLTNTTAGLMEWSLDFEVKPSTFKVFDPLPLLLGVLVEVPGLRRHSGSLYTIMAELYTNALDHGVLGLDSGLKNTADGFAEYYQLRQTRLQALAEGYVRFRLRHQPSISGGSLTIRVEDSGNGFDFSQKMANDHKTEGYSGRGLPLLKDLCQSLSYFGNGNQVEAVFTWTHDH